jgi:hypothetical protein
VFDSVSPFHPILTFGMQASGTPPIRLGIEVADSFKRTSLLQGGMKMSKSVIALFLGSNVITLFAAVIYEWSVLARVFVLGKSFQLSLMFAVKTKS